MRNRVTFTQLEKNDIGVRKLTRLETVAADQGTIEFGQILVCESSYEDSLRYKYQNQPFREESPGETDVVSIALNEEPVDTTGQEQVIPVLKLGEDIDVSQLKGWNPPLLDNTGLSLLMLGLADGGSLADATDFYYVVYWQRADGRYYQNIHPLGGSGIVTADPQLTVLVNFIAPSDAVGGFIKYSNNGGGTWEGWRTLTAEDVANNQLVDDGSLTWDADVSANEPSIGYMEPIVRMEKNGLFLATSITPSRERA